MNEDINFGRKLWALVGLCLVFLIVLGLFYQFGEQRGVFGVRAANVVATVDDYRMIVRSVKYGALLVVLVFTVFFMCEVLQGWRIHPIQYLLVGSALTLFYLLLLSFAEHFGFVMAYIIGAVACITLIVWYLRFVLPESTGVIAMGILLCIAYGVMFILLRMEQYNLLLGSCLLFLTLFAVMFCTRNVDWYTLSHKK